jgi:hypothetical protein
MHIGVRERVRKLFKLWKDLFIMKGRNIVSLVFVSLGVLVAILSSIIMFLACSGADSYSCSYGGTWALVLLVWGAGSLVLVGILIFLIGLLISKMQSKG